MHIFTYKELAFFHECIVRYKSRNEYVHLTSDEVDTLDSKILSDLGSSVDSPTPANNVKPIGKGEYLDQILAQLAYLCERLTEELPDVDTDFSHQVNAVGRARMLAHMIDDYLYPTGGD